MGTQEGILRWRLGLGCCLLLAAATLLVYRPSFAYPFVDFDDWEYVSHNHHVRAGLTADGVRYAFTTFDCGNWHPLTWLSLELDSSLFGDLKAGGFHFTNVLLHLASTLTLFLVLVRMTAAVWPSFLVAGLFAWHPLQVESVAWVSERKAVLSTLFWMLTMAAYLAYARRPGLMRYLLVALSFALGLMAKPMLVTLPCVLLLLDYWPLGRLQLAHSEGRPGDKSAICNLQAAIAEKLPLLGLALASCLVTLLAQRQGKALLSLQKLPLDARIENALVAYWSYLGKMVWPVRLAAFYPRTGPEVPFQLALIAGSALVLSTLVILFASRRRYLGVGWLWYLGTLVPVIGIVQVGDQAMADRYASVPLIGISLLLSWTWWDLWPTVGQVSQHALEQVPQPAALRSSPGNLLRLSLAAAGIGVLAVSLMLTRKQVEYWRGDLELWQHALAVTQNNAEARINLGLHFYRQHELDQALAQLTEAARLNAADVRPHVHLSNTLRELTQPEEAVAELRKAIELDPAEAMLHFNVANLLSDLGRNQEALAELQNAARLDPSHPVPHNSLGDLLQELGRGEEAVAEYRRAIELDPEYSAPYLGLGNVLFVLGRPAEALAAFRLAIQMEPTSPLPHNNLAMALQAQGQLDEASAEYRQAFQLGYPSARARLLACERLRQLEGKLPDFLAGRIQPADNAERLAFADLCAQPFESRFVLAARLYAEAFHADPREAQELGAATRFRAALAAAQAGCGRGRDAAVLDDVHRTRLRRQALTWLHADLVLARKQATATDPRARAAVRQGMRIWQRHPGLAGVREPAALARLPDAERQAWQQLWRAVEAAFAEASAIRSAVSSPPR
jgi:tetratricopeptide (TPR) repeat protein